MSSLEDLSWRVLQRLASKYGVKANMKRDKILAELIEIKARLIEEEEKKDDGVDDGVKWFKQAGNNFEIGVELYKGGFPLVKGDDRTYMKVHMRGMPIKFKGAIVGDACQLFYLSSGKNSNLGGVWLPTNVISLKMREEGGKRVWGWYAQKKPWYIGGKSNASTRFGGDPSVAMISQILGCLRKNCDIKKIKDYVTKNLKSHLKTVFGEKTAEKKWKEMNDYCKEMSDEIKDYLQDKWENVEHPKCDNYDINIWIKKCNSYNWFAPFDPDKPDYIPILDPLDISKDSLWEEGGKEGNTGLILKSGWLDNPTDTMKYVKLKNDILVEKNKARLKMTETGLKRLKTRRTHLHYGTIEKDLASRDKLLTRQKEVTPTKYSPVQSSSRQNSSSFSPKAESKKQLRALEYKIKDLTGSFPLSTQSCENCEKEVEIHQRVRMDAEKMGLKGGGLKGERLQYMKDLCIDCAERECNLYKRLTKLGIKAINKEKCFAKLRRAEMVKKW